jgi:hypothetical protein
VPEIRRRAAKSKCSKLSGFKGAHRDTVVSAVLATGKCEE